MSDKYQEAMDGIKDEAEARIIDAELNLDKVFDNDANKRVFGRGKTFAGAMETVAPDHEVYHPSHYTFGKYEVIDVLLDWFPDDPLLWQVGKYIARATRKGNELQDLEKARFYLDKRIELAREKSNTPK